MSKQEALLSMQQSSTVDETLSLIELGARWDRITNYNSRETLDIALHPTRHIPKTSTQSGHARGSSDPPRELR